MLGLSTSLWCQRNQCDAVNKLNCGGILCERGEGAKRELEGKEGVKTSEDWSVILYNLPACEIKRINTNISNN